MLPFRSDFTSRTSTPEPPASIATPATGSSPDASSSDGFDAVLRDVTRNGGEAAAPSKSAPKAAPAPKSVVDTAKTAGPTATPPSTSKASTQAAAASTSNTSSKADSTSTPASTDAQTPQTVPTPTPEPLVLQIRNLAGAAAIAQGDGQPTEQASTDVTSDGPDASSHAGGAPGSSPVGSNGNNLFPSLASRFIAGRFQSTGNASKGTKPANANAVPDAKTVAAVAATQAQSTSSSSVSVAPVSQATQDSQSNQSSGQSDAAAAAIAAAMLGTPAIAATSTPGNTTTATSASGSQGDATPQGVDANAMSASAGSTGTGAAPLIKPQQSQTAFAASTTPQTAGVSDANSDIEDATTDDDAIRGLAGVGASASTTESSIAAALRTAAGVRATGATKSTPASTSTGSATNAQAPVLGANGDAKSSVTVTTSSLVAKASSTTATPDAVRPSAAPSASSGRPMLTISMPDLVSFNTNRSPAGALDAPALLASDTDAPAVLSQIVQAMRVQAAQGGGTAQVTLQPGYLGGVTLSVRVDQDGVSASVVADTPAVREALRTQEPALRQALGDQGLRLDHFDVSEPAETPRKQSGGGQQAPQDQSRQGRQKRRDPSEPAFEFVA